jgi:hypothetical protein
MEPEIELADTRLSESEKRRLSKQCRHILSMLRERRRTNVELAKVSLKYTSRISDLQKSGYDVRLVGKSGGVTTYELVEKAG